MHLQTLIPSLLTMLDLSNAHSISHNAHLRADVYHLPSLPIHYQNVSLHYSPSAFTLIHSSTSAILVDAPTRSEDASHLADWIATKIPGKNLAYIYITHAHADHFNAFPTLLQHFPSAQVVTTEKVLQHMPAQYEAPLWDAFWLGLFPTLEKADLSLVHALPASLKFYISGAEGKKHEFRAIEVGEGDTADSTVMYVPELDLVVGGDVVYGQCYQYLAENPTAAQRQGWVDSLGKIEALGPKVVVPSHMQAGEGYGVEHLDETREYIRGWEELLAEAETWEELEGLATRRWPGRVGSFILRYTAQTFFNATF